MLKVQENKCNQCLFSKDRIVSTSRMKDILKKCEKNDTHFICHKSKDAVCAGFYENKSTNLIRIAGRLKMIQFVNEK